MPKPNMGKGDSGFSILFGTGKKTRKDDVQFEVLGTLDELNSNIGYVCSIVRQEDIKKLLFEISNHIFTIQANIAVEKNYSSSKIPEFKAENVRFIEENIMKYEKNLSELSNFILPFGTQQAAYFHICRTLTRRLERRISSYASNSEVDKSIQSYINRLSDLFFILARFSNKKSRKKDVIWRHK